MEQLLKAYNVSKLNQDETDNLNSPITITKIEFVIQIFPQKKSLGQMLLPENSVKLKNKNTTNFANLSQKI